MKKAILLCSIVVLSLFFCGCDKVIELTEDENYLIAEYAAELLLKYDRNIDSKYYEALEDSSKNTTTEALTSEEMQSEETTEEPDPSIMTTEENADSSEESSTESGIDVVNPVENENISIEQEEEGVKADEGSSYDFGSFIDEDNISVVYAYYLLTDHYPSYDKDGVYIEIQAPAGYKLLVLKFDVESKINEDQYLDLYNKDLEYNIIVNNQKSAKQMLTILMDDLYTYQSNLKGSGREELVLLFQISDNVADNISDLKLRVKNGEKEKVIQLD